LTRVDGTSCVESATAARLENLKPLAGTEFSLECDCVCIAVGLTPLTELLALAGCRMLHVGQLGGTVAWHDANMRTSLEHIYVAGDASGIEEASTAMVEGRLAGAHAAMSLGIQSRKAEELIAGFRCQLDELRKGPFGQKACAGKAVLQGLAPGGRKSFSRGAAAAPFEKGVRAVIECYQNIPCNPCVTACKQGAITKGTDINELPRLDPQKCTAQCPGLAIFLVNKRPADGKAEVGVPYELLPLPRKGQEVFALGRGGEVVCEARVTKVRAPKAFDRTAVVYLEVPLEHADDVRFFSTRDGLKTPPVKQDPVTGTTDILICRCEDIYQSQIETLIDEGYHSFDELKRVLRCGMGPCQGKTCERLVLGLLARKLGKKVEELDGQTVRSPIMPTNLGEFADSDMEWNLADWPERKIKSGDGNA
jgi:Fe-S-cluster-containing hydrogenase component 2/bacterioferritin-associated ferredoxin